MGRPPFARSWRWRSPLPAKTSSPTRSSTRCSAQTIRPIARPGSRPQREHGRRGWPALASTGLADPSARVRAAAAEAFAPALHAEGTDEPAALALLVAALDDDALPVRRAAAQTLAGHDLAATTLVEVLETGSERAQEAAVRGLEGTGDEGIEPVRAWARERVAG